MPHRIALYTELERKPKHTKKTTTTRFVEVDDAKSLITQLGALGAKRVGLLRRDRFGTSHLEGEEMAVDQLTDKHIAWVGSKAPEFESRGVFYSL
jgi:hypothetical protein